MTTALSITGFFYACGDENEMMEADGIEYLALSPRADLSKIGLFNKQDLAIMEKAFVRLGLDRMSPEEAFAVSKNPNMSQEIYDFYYNLYFRNNGIRSNRVRVKTKGEGKDEPKTLMYAIQDILDSFGVKITEGEITSWATKKGYYYPGQGVPQEHMKAVLENYFYYVMDMPGNLTGGAQLKQDGISYIAVVKKPGESFERIYNIENVIGNGSNTVYICKNPLDNRENDLTTNEVVSVYGVASAR